MVLSEGKRTPSLLSSHLMAETPTWAKASDSSCLLMETISALSLSLILVGLLTGALDLSLYQCKSPVWKRLSHLKNHGFERFSSVQIVLGDSPFTLYLKSASFLISSSMWQAPLAVSYFGAYCSGNFVSG